MMPAMPAGIGMQPGQGPQVFGMEGQTWPMQGMDGNMSGAALDDNDNWSSSSRSGPTAPTTLNVEDWYVLPGSFSSFTDCHRFQFFGINGGFGDLGA